MNKKFDIYLLPEAEKFLDSLPDNAVTKIVHVIENTATTPIPNPSWFKKLNSEIYEFRASSNSIQYRLLAFWDKRNKEDVLVVATHGFIKKTQKTPPKEIDKAEKIRKRYFNGDYD